MMQEQLMKYSPDTGEERPYPSNAKQWREYHGRVAWLYNPWTGEKRDLRDIGSDVLGELIVPPSVETSNVSYSGNCTYQNTNRYHGDDVILIGGDPISRKHWDKVYGDMPTLSENAMNKIFSNAVERFGSFPEFTLTKPVSKALFPCSYVMVDASNVERGNGSDKVDDFPNTLKRRFYELTHFQREILANNYTKVEHYRDNEWRTKKGTYFHKDGIYRVAPVTTN